MKQLILAVALIAATFTSAFAARPTKAENDAAMKAGRKALAAKVIELESSVRNHNTQSFNTVSVQVLDLMRKGMMQTGVDINFQTAEQQNQSFKHYNQIEMTIHEYTLLLKEPATNTSKLVEHAQAFMKSY